MTQMAQWIKQDKTKNSSPWESLCTVGKEGALLTSKSVKHRLGQVAESAVRLKNERRARMYMCK